MKKVIVALILPIIIVGCALNVKTINRGKKLDPVLKETSLQRFANDYFWDNFHQGNYGNIDSVLYYLAAAYNENPNHLETVNHLGFTNLWKLSERSNLEMPDPTITDHAILALKYYGESYNLNPKDPRILGFVADMKMTIGDISQDKKLSRQGYFEGLKAIRQWPEFNYFGVGVTLTGLPHEQKQYQKALKWQWKTLDKCFCEKFDREKPDLLKYLHLEKTETDLKRRRTCWNTWITPHNLEGFFLNMGDMLVKNGDWKKAQEIYALIKQVPQYESWDYHELLETRILNAKENVNKFRAPLDNTKIYHDNDVMFINTSISCMGCHKKSAKDLQYYEKVDWPSYREQKNVYFLK